MLSEKANVAPPRWAGESMTESTNKRTNNWSDGAGLHAEGM
jgi:hypothetical protein